MKYYFIRIEIQDGEHGYYHRLVCTARDEKSAKNKAEREAKTWYEADVETTTDPSNGSKSYYFPEVQVGTWVYNVGEIPKADYEILKEYL